MAAHTDQGLRDIMEQNRREDGKLGTTSCNTVAILFVCSVSPYYSSITFR